MGDKLYAVAAGDYNYYDDYEIVALCTSKTKAEEIAQRLSGEYAEIVTVEEYDNADNCDIDVYSVAFDRNYKVSVCSLSVGKHDEKEFEIVYDKWDYIETYAVKVHANSRAEAIKAARDKLTEYKAREFGLNEREGEI